MPRSNLNFHAFDIHALSENEEHQGNACESRGWLISQWHPKASTVLSSLGEQLGWEVGVCLKFSSLTPLSQALVLEELVRQCFSKLLTLNEFLSMSASFTCGTSSH